MPKRYNLSIASLRLQNLHHVFFLNHCLEGERNNLAFRRACLKNWPVSNFPILNSIHKHLPK